MVAAVVIALVLFTFQESGLSVSDEDFAPRNLHFQAVDLNLTLKWNPPTASLLEGEAILHTVVRRKESKGEIEDEHIPHCINISHTDCYLLPMFKKIKDFAFKERFVVISVSTTRSNYTGRSKPKAFTGTDVVASAPVIHNRTITACNITVWIHGPNTPFVKKGRNLFLVEDVFKRSRISLQNIYFNSSLQRENVIDFVKKTSMKESSDGRAEIVYSHLLPYTKYTLTIQSRLHGKFSENVTTLKFQTEQTAPDVGPFLSGIEVVRRYCDYRDIKISWQESRNQRQNVALTKYVVDVTDSETNETTNISVPASLWSVTLRKLNRWHRYYVTVTSFNSAGRKDGEKGTFEEDTAMLETYIPAIKDLVEEPPNKQTLMWIPPRDHEQCITGYIVEVRTIDDSLEEQLFVDGFNTSSVSLHLTNPGRYKIVLRPNINDSVGTTVESTTEHDVKDLKRSEGYIFAGLALFITIIVTGTIIMTKKVCCDTSSLPEISKIKTMNSVRDNQPLRSSLRKPPEKEIFHATRIPASNHFEAYPFSHCENEDGVFQPQLSSTSVLAQTCQYLEENILVTKEIDDYFSSQTIDDEKSNQIEVVPSHGAGCDLPDDRIPTNTIPENGSWAPSLPDGYVPHSLSKKRSDLRVYIPGVSSRSRQSLSSDSGFSSSPSSQSDYIPPSPFTDSSYFKYTVNTSASNSEDSPYVKTEIAGRHGRIPSTSISSDVASEGPMYNRIDSRQSMLDPHTEGYLTMRSSLPSQ